MLLFARRSGGTGTRPAYLREIASGCIKVSINGRDFQWLERNIEPTGVNRSRMLFRWSKNSIANSFFPDDEQQSFLFFSSSFAHISTIVSYIYLYISKKKKKRKKSNRRFSFYFFIFFNSKYPDLHKSSINSESPPSLRPGHDETRLISSRRNPFPCKRAKRSISLPVTYVRVP